MADISLGSYMGDSRNTSYQLLDVNVEINWLRYLHYQPSDDSSLRPLPSPADLLDLVKREDQRALPHRGNVPILDAAAGHRLGSST